MQVCCHRANTQPVKAVLEPDTSVRQRGKLGAHRRAQAAVSQARLDEDVVCFEIQPLKPRPGAADVPGCAAQKEGGGPKLARRSWSTLLFTYRESTQIFPCFKSKMSFWSSCLKRAAQILPKNKHFRFPHYFSSKYFMAICRLSFTLSSAWNVNVATVQRQEK